MRFRSLRFPLVLLGVLVLVAAAWLILAARTYRLGFPLDDAWIHQIFARNLAQRGEWAFLPGKPSAGSTGPLWGALLALGYGLHLAPLAWTAALGTLALWAMALLVWREWPRWMPHRITWRVPMALTLALEWHLLWAALSGMETALFALLCLVVLLWIQREPVPWGRVGTVVGLACWLRPDGLTLLGPALVVVAWRQPKAAARLLGAFAGLFLPYLAFNRALAGQLWPNTFYAKQAEYAVLRTAPFLQRLLREYLPLLAGMGVVLLPGLFLAARRGRWPVWAALAWVFGYPALYAWRLPVIYQHGRYVLPVLPAWIAFGWWGMAAWLQPTGTRMIERVLSRAWLASLGLVGLLFLGLGARAYARDVAFIESEMVDTARWIAAHTSPDALVAAHDIGALGYFGGREVLDLAGLVSPEVIPFLRDEPRLAAYLERRGADWLVTFPGWYPQLTRNRSPVYCSPGKFSLRMGGEQMCVYRWR